MSFLANNNSIKIRDTSGRLTFSTEGKMPYIYDTVSGSFTLPGASGSEFINETIVLKSNIKPETNFLLSQVKQDTMGGEDYWMNANGSTTLRIAILTPGADYLIHYTKYDFMIENNDLVVKAKGYNFSSFASFGPATVEYKIHLGIYT